MTSRKPAWLYGAPRWLGMSAARDMVWLSVCQRLQLRRGVGPWNGGLTMHISTLFCTYHCSQAKSCAGTKLRFIVASMGGRWLQQRGGRRSGFVDARIIGSSRRELAAGTDVGALRVGMVDAFGP